MSKFRFKQFSVSQDRAAMKVGTDGVLLGAWVSLNGVKSVLDVGTGTGLISLMLAQRSELLKVSAIEICEDAIGDAKANFDASSWGDRLDVISSSLQEFKYEAYDLIISNPPFFEASMLSEDVSRSKARHQEFLSVKTLISYAVQSNSKRLAVIYPIDSLQSIRKIAEEFNWHISRVCWVKPTLLQPVKRVMLELSADFQTLIEEELVIEDKGRHQYSDAYINLTKEFYLKM